MIVLHERALVQIDVVYDKERKGSQQEWGEALVKNNRDGN